jgi:hypothetical protein
MRRWGRLALLLAIALGVLLGGTAWAASPGISAELLVLLPNGKQLRVYEQVVLSNPGSITKLGVLVGHGPVKGVNVKISGVGANHVDLQSAKGTIAVEYDVPFKGTAQYLSLRQYLPVSALVVMLPPPYTLPSVLNAAFQNLAPRTIPGLPDSPKFNVYETTKVEANTVTAFSMASGGTVTTGRQGYPGVGSIMLLVLALVVLGGLYVAVNWSPLSGRAHARAQRADLMERLAAIEALHRRGELEDMVYRVEREGLLGELARVWTPEGV